MRKTFHRSDDDDRLVAYGESIGPPCAWPQFMTRTGAFPMGSGQECDDEGYLEYRWRETDGLFWNTEGEAIGDFC